MQKKLLQLKHLGLKPLMSKIGEPPPLSPVLCVYFLVRFGFDLVSLVLGRAAIAYPYCASHNQLHFYRSTDRPTSMCACFLRLGFVPAEFEQEGGMSLVPHFHLCV